MGAKGFFDKEGLISVAIGICIGALGCALFYFYLAPPHSGPSPRGEWRRGMTGSGGDSTQRNLQRQMMREMRNSQNGGQRQRSE